MNTLAIKNTDSISRGIIYSIIGHIVIVGIFTVKAVFFPSEDITFQSAVRVDIVGLPDKYTPQTLPTEEPSPAKELKEKSEPLKEIQKEVVKEISKQKEKEIKSVEFKKDNEAINLDKLKHKEKDAINKLKALSALDKIKDDVSKENKKKTSSSTKIKGNILSAGTALTGLNKLQHETYIESLDAHIKQNWALPEWLAKKNLRAQIKIKIDESGNIISKQIVKSSGNSSYDDVAMDTVVRSAPFPKPPEKFIDILSNDGILIGFPE